MNQKKKKGTRLPRTYFLSHLNFSPPPRRRRWRQQSCSSPVNLEELHFRPDDVINLLATKGGIQRDSMIPIHHTIHALIISIY